MKKLFALILMFALIGTVVSALAETWTCANCGKESEGNFCSWCGAAKPPEKVICPSCGAEFDPDAGFAFCNNCGAVLEQKSVKEVSVDDIITFGHYEQDNNLDNGPEPIEWIVLDVQDGKALLLSKYGLETMKYNLPTDIITWENCDLRTWLNSSFVNKAFTKEEQSAIQLTEVDNSEAQGYSQWHTLGGNNTQDKVFLLSYAEANRYLDVSLENKNNQKARVAPTVYALEKRCYIKNDYQTADGQPAGWWWLRSPGYTQYTVADVLHSGSLDYNNMNDSSAVVRPALWVDLGSGIF